MIASVHTWSCFVNFGREEAKDLNEKQKDNFEINDNCITCFLWELQERE